MHRFKKLGLFVLALFFVLPLFAIAQDEAVDIGALMVNAQIVFVSGLGGLSVTALTEVLKRAFKFRGIASVILSIVISIVASLFYLMSTSQFTIISLLIYSTIVALVANGIFKFPKKT